MSKARKFIKVVASWMELTEDDKANVVFDLENGKRVCLMVHDYNDNLVPPSVLELDPPPVQGNPECKRCGLLRSTVLGTGHLCIDVGAVNMPPHDFGEGEIKG